MYTFQAFFFLVLFGTSFGALLGAEREPSPYATASRGGLYSGVRRAQSQYLEPAAAAAARERAAKAEQERADLELAQSIAAADEAEAKERAARADQEIADAKIARELSEEGSASVATPKVTRPDRAITHADRRLAQQRASKAAAQRSYESRVAQQHGRPAAQSPDDRQHHVRQHPTPAARPPRSAAAPLPHLRRGHRPAAAQRMAGLGDSDQAAIAASVAADPQMIEYNRRKMATGAEDDALLTECDMNPPLFDNSRSKIKQAPALYQFYPYLSRLYGAGYNELCGYYCIYFTKVLLERWNSSPEELNRALCDRMSLHSSVLDIIASGGSYASLERNIHEDRILDFLDMIGVDTHNVAIAHDTDVDAEVGNRRMNDLVDHFTDGTTTRAVVFFNRGVHWFVGLARKIADDEVEFIVVDPAGHDRRGDEQVLEIASRFEQ